MRKNLKTSIKGIGVDIVRIDRFDIDKSHFIQRVLSDEELEVFYSLSSSHRKKEFLAGRFAAKEAFLKASLKGIGEIPFKSISVLNDVNGAPYLNFDNAFVSISHEEEYAIAFVVLQEDEAIDYQ